MNSSFLFSLIFYAGASLLITALFESHSFYAQISIGQEVDTTDMKKNAKCSSANKFYYDLDVNSISMESSHTKSLVLDLGCLKKISTIDVAWKNSNSVQYNFTLTILSDNRTIENMFTFHTNTIPSSNFQTAGLGNTLGRMIILTIDEPKNSKVEDSIEKVSINTVQAEPNKIMDSGNEWVEISKKYFSNITIGNTQDSSIAQLYRVTDGDDVDVANPNFTFAKPLDITNTDSIFIRVPYHHTEGIIAKIESANPPYNLQPLNATLDVESQAGLKSFYFNIDKTKLNDTKKLDNLTIMLATSSETSLYYKSKINVD